MKDSFPFTDYDFWAYISTGFVFLFTLDHAMQYGLMVRQSWTVVEGLFAVACAYAVGQMLAGVASAVLERRIVRWWLKPPSLTLFDDAIGPGWFRWLYPSFYERLPTETRQRILAKATSDGISAPGEAMFWVAFDAAKVNTASMTRMSSFLNQYGMCRNLSMTAFVCAGMLVGIAHWQARPIEWQLVGAALFLGVAMFLRYLKFYRHYAVEVFTTYAHTK